MVPNRNGYLAIVPVPDQELYQPVCLRVHYELERPVFDRWLGRVEERHPREIMVRTVRIRD